MKDVLMSPFLQARDFLLTHREDYVHAYGHFRWPVMETFNWALDYFDPMAKGNPRLGLWIVEDSGEQTRLTFDELSRRSSQGASFLRDLGIRRGDCILLLLPNTAVLWEMTLAAMKIGAVICPSATLLTPTDLQDRVSRGNIRCVLTDQAGVGKCSDLPKSVVRIVTPGEEDGWYSWEEVDARSETFEPDGPTRANDPLLLYFTSGTTARPKMVLHTHQSYPVGHLSTMYWIGLKPGDVHWNISSPGWAKHAWSCIFAPWNAEATVFVYNQPRFDAKKALTALVKHEITTLCAPPTVWRMLILEDLKAYAVQLREIVGAGEPLNPEVIDRVKDAWGITIRDGYGQTETTALIGNSPGQPVKPGSMGRPLPGYDMTIDAARGDAQASQEGEVLIRLHPRPAGLMSGYLDMPATSGDQPFYHTADIAQRDADGYFWYIGRSDDVFKSSDYRISPFEIESALLEHDAVAEAAVVPSPDPIRLSVPKAFIVLKPGIEPTLETARSLFGFLRQRLAPFQRVRRLEFGELPKTLSGKIRRVELRQREQGRAAERPTGEFWEEM